MGSLERYTGPLYRRIADDLLDQVREGALHPGDKLPSERALCAIYAVSQITVRRALRELRHGGVLVSRHGLGWYVQSGPHAGVAVPAGDLTAMSATTIRSSSCPGTPNPTVGRRLKSSPGTFGRTSTFTVVAWAFS